MIAVTMTKPTFDLLSNISGAVQDGPEPAVVQVPLRGHSTKTIKKRVPVAPGTLVAEHPDPAVGDVHSPIWGVVTDVTETAVTITAGSAPPAKEGEEPPRAAPVAPVDIASLAGEDLKDALKTLGISTRPFGKASTLIVNGLNPEPATGIAELLLSDFRQTIEKGFSVFEELVEPSETFLAVAEGSFVSLEGGAVKTVPATYPNSLNPLVIKALTGKESARDVTVVSVMELFAVGRVAETGMPLTETVLTLGEAAFRVKVGTPLAAVLEHAGVTAAPLDRVVVGGPMRGRAVPSLEAGVSKDDYSLLVVPHGAFPMVTDRACINCGECTLVCPSRIMPGFVARYVEFKMYGKAGEFRIDTCMDCGLCGYVCTVRRPMLQLIRLGKEVLEIKSSTLASCRLQGG
jgi:Na+-translocating ferredoxin:NAD+ oxidoreductase subunit C